MQRGMVLIGTNADDRQLDALASPFLTRGRGIFISQQTKDLPMAVEQFDFETIVDIDEGRIRQAWEQAMKRARLDCEDRPGVDKARKVVLVCTLTPVADSGGGLDTVDVRFEIDDSLPKRQSANYNMKAGKGGLLFNEFSPDDVNQGTLDSMGPTGVTSDAS